MKSNQALNPAFFGAGEAGIGWIWVIRCNGSGDESQATHGDVEGVDERMESKRKKLLKREL